MQSPVDFSRYVSRFAVAVMSHCGYVISLTFTDELRFGNIMHSMAIVLYFKREDDGYDLNFCGRSFVAVKYYECFISCTGIANRLMGHQATPPFWGYWTGGGTDNSRVCSTLLIAMMR